MIFWLKSIQSLIKIHSCKKQCFKSKVMEKCSIGLSMPEWIKVPSNTRSHIKLFLQPLMPHNEIADNILIVSSAFLSTDPAPHGDLKLTILDKALSLVLYVLLLPTIPHVKVFHFDTSKGPIWVKS